MTIYFLNKMCIRDRSFTVEQLRLEMNRLAAQLPEYQVVMAMKGVGPSLGPQLMAEIGDLSRFSHREALTAFAGVDPGVNQSGTYEARSVRTSKRGSPQLRKTLFQIMDVLIKSAPSDDVFYRFLEMCIRDSGITNLWPDGSLTLVSLSVRLIQS